MKVAFIGLGIMGSRMANNLLEKGVALTLYNRTASAADELVAKGATLAASAQACVEDADIVFTMLSKPEVTETVAFGEKGFVAAMKAGALWVDSTTVNPSFTLEMAQRAKAANINYLEAPVAGSKNQAAQAILVFFCGGTEAAVAQATPFMEKMGRKVIHVGETSKGASLKMLVNSMLAQSMLMFTENVLLGEKMGLDREFLLKMLPELPVVAPFVKFKVDNIRKDTYEPEFPLELMQKDLHLAAISAYENQIPQYLANTTKEVFAGALNKGMGRRDFSAIFKYLAE